MYTSSPLFLGLIAAILVSMISNVECFRPILSSKTAAASLKVSPLFNQLKDEAIPANESEQQQRERLRKKARKMMFNENGVAYAPWIANQVDEDAIVEDLIRKEAKGPSARSQMKASALDSGSMETSEGMKWRQVGNQIEVGWVTGIETDNKGYCVEKRPSYGGDFVEIASFNEVAGLVTKGPSGGKYRYVDPTAAAGSWVYRVQDCDARGKKNVLCQCFVEVETESDSKQTAVVAIGLVGALAAAAVLGYSLDPPL